MTTSNPERPPPASSFATRYILPSLTLIFIVIASATQTEVAHTLTFTHKYNQPYFTFFLTHISFSIVFPIHLLILLILYPSTPTSFYISGLRHLISLQLSFNPQSSGWKRLLKPWVIKISWLTALISIPALSWFIAVLYSPAMDITAIYATSSFWAYGFSMYFLNQPLSRITIGSIGLAFAGVVVLSLDGLGGEEGKGRAFGDLVMMFGAILLGLYEVVYKMILPEDQHPHPLKEEYQPIPTSSEFVLEDEDDEPIPNGKPIKTPDNDNGGIESQDVSDQELSEDGRRTPPHSNIQNGHLTNGYNTLKSPKSIRYSKLPKRTNSYHLSTSPTHSHSNRHGHLNGSFPDMARPTERPSSADRKFSRTPLLPSPNQPLQDSSLPPSIFAQPNSVTKPQHDSSTDIHLPPALHANFITSCIGAATIILLWPPLIFLHYVGWEVFKWPSSENSTSLHIWSELAVVAFGGAIYNAGLMILIGIWGPTTSSVANLLTIGLVAVIDAVLMGLMPTLQTLIGVGMICIGFGILLWEGEG